MSARVADVALPSLLLYNRSVGGCNRFKSGWRQLDNEQSPGELPSTGVIDCGRIVHRRVGCAGAAGAGEREAPAGARRPPRPLCLEPLPAPPAPAPTTLLSHIIAGKCTLLDDTLVTCDVIVEKIVSCRRCSPWSRVVITSWATSINVYLRNENRFP